MLGLAITAWAQVPAEIIVPETTNEFSLLVDALASGGLPAVLAWVGWRIGRMGPPTVRVVLISEDSDS